VAGHGGELTSVAAIPRDRPIPPSQSQGTTSTFAEQDQCATNDHQCHAQQGSRSQAEPAVAMDTTGAGSRKAKTVEDLQRLNTVTLKRMLDHGAKKAALRFMDIIRKYVVGLRRPHRTAPHANKRGWLVGKLTPWLGVLGVQPQDRVGAAVRPAGAGRERRQHRVGQEGACA
jgi:hypothetical protein